MIAIYNHNGVVGRDCNDPRDNLAAILDEEVHHSREGFERDCRGRNHEAHHRLQFLAQFDGKFVYSLLGFFQTGHDSIVLNVKLPVDRGGLGESLVSHELLRLDLVDMIGERRERRYGTGAVFAHILEHRREDIHVAGLFESREELDQGGVHIGFNQISELLHIHPGDTGILGRVLIDTDNNLRESRRGRFELLVIGVQNGGEAHNLLHGHTGLRPYATHSGSELGDIGSGSRTVLRQFIDNGTDREQSLLGAEALFVAEDAGKF